MILVAKLINFIVRYASYLATSAKEKSIMFFPRRTLRYLNNKVLKPYNIVLMSKDKSNILAW